MRVILAARRGFRPSDKRDADQQHGVHDLAAARRWENGSLSSGAFSVAALLDGGWGRELAPRGGNVGGWDRFLIRETFNGSPALGPGLKRPSTPAQARASL